MRSLFQVVTTVATLASSFIFTQAASAQVELVQNGSLTAPGVANTAVPSPWMLAFASCDTNDVNFAVGGEGSHYYEDTNASPDGGTFVGCGTTGE